MGGRVVALIFLFKLLAYADTLAQDTTRMVADATPKRIITIGRLLVVGNKRTLEKIITRELTLKSGDTINTKRIEEVIKQDQKKLYNLRIFNTVEISMLELTPGTVDLLVEVSERWYTFPAPIFELSDRNFNEWWQNYNHSFKRVNYGMRLYQYNFRGRNETLRFTAQFGYVRKFELLYRIPYIDKKQRQGLIFEINYGEPKNLADSTIDHKLRFIELKETIKTQRSFSISYTYRKSFYETHSLSLNYQNNDIADTIAQSNPNYYGNGKTTQQFGSITYTFNSEHRDVIAYPLKGYQFTIFAQRTGFLVKSDVKQWEANLTYSRFINLGKNYYFSNFSSIYLSTPNSIPYSFYSAIGYRKQIIKGYEVYVIEGPKFFLNKTTLRKRIFSGAWHIEEMPINQFKYLPLAIYLKGYFDWGYVENYPAYENNEKNTRLSNRVLYGTGGGIDIVTAYDAVIRLEYTFTREKTNGFFFHLKKEF